MDLFVVIFCLFIQMMSVLAEFRMPAVPVFPDFDRIFSQTLSFGGSLSRQLDALKEEMRESCEYPPVLEDIKYLNSHIRLGLATLDVSCPTTAAPTTPRPSTRLTTVPSTFPTRAPSSEPPVIPTSPPRTFRPRTSIMPTNRVTDNSSPDDGGADGWRTSRGPETSLQEIVTSDITVTTKPGTTKDAQNPFGVATEKPVTGNLTDKKNTNIIAIAVSSCVVLIAILLIIAFLCRRATRACHSAAQESNSKLAKLHRQRSDKKQLCSQHSLDMSDSDRGSLNGYLNNRDSVTSNGLANGINSRYSRPSISTGAKHRPEFDYDDNSSQVTSSSGSETFRGNYISLSIDGMLDNVYTFDNYYATLRAVDAPNGMYGGFGETCTDKTLPKNKRISRRSGGINGIGTPVKKETANVMSMKTFQNSEINNNRHAIQNSTDSVPIEMPKAAPVNLSANVPCGLDKQRNDSANSKISEPTYDDEEVVAAHFEGIDNLVFSEVGDVSKSSASLVEPPEAFKNTAEVVVHHRPKEPSKTAEVPVRSSDNPVAVVSPFNVNTQERKEAEQLPPYDRVSSVILNGHVHTEGPINIDIKQAGNPRHSNTPNQRTADRRSKPISVPVTNKKSHDSSTNHNAASKKRQSANSVKNHVAKFEATKL